MISSNPTFNPTTSPTPTEDAGTDLENSPGPFGRFWKATRIAGAREDALSFKQRFKGMFWDFNMGRIRGLARGILKNAKILANPRSIYNQSQYDKLFEDIRNFDQELLETGTQFMESNWEQRGELLGEQSFQGALNLVKGFFMSKNLASGLKTAITKF